MEAAKAIEIIEAVADARQQSQQAKASSMGEIADTT